MEIETHIYTKEEAWKFIMDKYYAYHRSLKKFGYDYNQFIPDLKSVKDMFEDDSHFQKMQKNEFYFDEVSDVRDNFYSFYDKEHFKDKEKYFNSEAKSEIEEILPKLEKLRDNWGMYIPDKLKVGFTYGAGGSYNGNKEQSSITLKTSGMSKEVMGSISIHEFVHVCIEEDIIQKYKIPQDIKEQIVDTICVDYLGTQKEKQNFSNHIGKRLINVEDIVEDLPKVAQNIQKAIQVNKINNRKKNAFKM